MYVYKVNILNYNLLTNNKYENVSYFQMNTHAYRENK